MTVPDRIAELSQRITALTGQNLGRDQVMAVVGRAFEYQVDLDDDGQLRGLVAGLASPAAVGAPTAREPFLAPPTGPTSAAPHAALHRPDLSALQSAPSGATAKTNSNAWLTRRHQLQAIDRWYKHGWSRLDNRLRGRLVVTHRLGAVAALQGANSVAIAALAATLCTLAAIEPRCTGMCGALATRAPSASNTAQEKSSLSLTLTE